MPTNQQLVKRARDHGILIPWRALWASRKVGVPYWVTCAFLMQESGGGENVFGHDPTIFIGAGEVTKDKYLRYKHERDIRAPHSHQMQGVGPMQLTWYSYQDRADALGGCWKPYYNVLAALEHLRDLHKAHGDWVDAARAYNGSGAAADHYARQMKMRFASWQGWLGV